MTSAPDRLPRSVRFLERLRLLPWAESTAIVLSDLETLEGIPISLSTRRVCAQAVGRLGTLGFAFKAGLELEFHLYRVGPRGQLEDIHPGWDLLGEDRLDRIEPVLEPIRPGLGALGFPPATIEAELGPSQIECDAACRGRGWRSSHPGGEPGR